MGVLPRENRPELSKAASSEQDGAMNPSPDEKQDAADGTESQRVVVVTQDGMGVSEQQGDESSRNPADLIEQPAKVMRIGAMVKQLLDEVRSAPLDEAGRTRLAEIHRRSITELEQGLAPELIEELERITLPFNDEAPSDAELRIAQAQLVGWLEGLFHGIQAALFAQQMAAQQQLQNMRRALPPGEPGQDGGPGQPPGYVRGMPNRPDPRESGSTGQYLSHPTSRASGKVVEARDDVGKQGAESGALTVQCDLEPHCRPVDPSGLAHRIGDTCHQSKSSAL